mgnify:CR=1 FL=1
MNIDKIKMVKPNNKEVITSINKDFTNIVNGEIKLNTGLASLSVNLVNSNIFTSEVINLVKGTEKKWLPSHFNAFAKIMVRDVLEDNFKQFDKVKKQALKKAIKIAVGFIVGKSLAKFTNDKHINAKGQIAVNSSKFSPTMKKKFDSKQEGGIKALTVKDSVSYVNDVLGLSDSNKHSTLKAQLEKVLATISNEKTGYGNDFVELPADCRNLYVPVRNKLQSIINALNIEVEDKKLYANK